MPDSVTAFRVQVSALHACAAPHLSIYRTIFAGFPSVEKRLLDYLMLRSSQLR